MKRFLSVILRYVALVARNAYQLGRTGDIRHIQYLESIDHGMCFLCNCFGYKRV